MSLGAQFIRMLGNVGQGVAVGLAQASTGSAAPPARSSSSKKKKCTPCEAIAAAQKARASAKSRRL